MRNRKPLQAGERVRVHTVCHPVAIWGTHKDGGTRGTVEEVRESGIVAVRYDSGLLITWHETHLVRLPRKAGSK